jgi:hypothetical protein
MFCPALPAAFKKLTASRQFNYKNVFRSPALPAAFSYGARRVEKVLPLMRHKILFFIKVKFSLRYIFAAI